MNNAQSILQNIIEDFSPHKFTRFFREISGGNFRELNEVIPGYNDDNFSNGNITGQIEIPGGNNISVITFVVNKSLSERSGKKAQYEIAKKYLRDNANYYAGIFIFYDNEGNFRFSLIFDIPLPNGKRNWSSFKRFTYFVSNEQTNKTFLLRVGGSDFSSIDSIRDAFSVDKVTKDFYREIANWYFWAMDNVKFPDDEDKDENQRNAKNLIRLITRIIFVWFMKEKKLVPSAIFDKKKIDKIINYKDKTGSTYYKAILQNLFFATLNTKMRSDDPDSRIFVDEAKKRGFLNDGYLQQGYYRYSRFIKNKNEFLKLFENIPFLNGGLFECLDKKIEGKEIRIDSFSDNPKNEGRFKIPDELFFLDEEINVDLSNHLASAKNKKVRGLLPILKSYNFTIDENTPVDEEVALDPELLGKVFENLLASYNPETATTARKSTGSYYTPREIVEYMVNESLVEYLKTALGVKGKDDEDGDESSNNIRALLDYNKDDNPFKDDRETTEKIIEAIEKIKILDPACGSGAFPMGILHKLVLALHKLDPDNKIWKKRLLERVPAEIREETEKSLRNKPLDYVRKLGLIENCIYGVDIQEIAIQISKLRFFISLLVEQEIDDTKPNRDVRALPNLETKFVAANTLIGLGKLPEELIDSEITNLSRKLFALREEIFYSNSRHQKHTLEEKEEKLRGNIEQALQDNYHKVIGVKIKKLEMEANELHKTLHQLKNKPEEIETVVTTNLFGERETKRINKTKEKINSFTRRLNDYYKQIEVLKNPKSDTSTLIAHKIASWDPFDQNTHADWFDPEWMFGVRDGFDVVIGNPPYIQMQKDNGRLANELKNQNYQTYIRTGDVYTIFYEVGFKLLNNNGVETFITSSQWMKTSYGKSLRKFLLSKNPLILIALGSGIFESAIVDTNILISTNTTYQNKLLGCKIDKSNQLEQFQSLTYYIMRYISDDKWIIMDELKQSINRKIIQNGKQLRKWELEINRGVVTGYNKAFIIDEARKNDLLKSDSRSSELIKPILKGRNIDKYLSTWSKDYILFIPWHFPLENSSISGASAEAEKLFSNKYEGVYKYFKTHKIGLSNRNKEETGIRYEWYALQRCAATYSDEFLKEKIIWKRIGSQLRFSYSDSAIYCLDSTCIATGEKIKYLTAILNSKLINYYLYETAPRTGMGDLIISVQALEPLYVYYPNKIEEDQFVSIVDKILTAKKQNPHADTKHLEDKIDIMVYKLYELTYEEVKVVDPEIEKIISKEEYERFEIE